MSWGSVPLSAASADFAEFIGQHQGRDVSLCWRLGEEKIHFWHELTAGFAGRKPVSTLIERA